MSDKKKSRKIIGSLNLKKDGSHTIKLGDFYDITINGKSIKGSYLNLTSPQEDLEFKLSKEYITKDEYEERLSKIPDYVKYNLSVTVEE